MRLYINSKRLELLELLEGYNKKYKQNILFSFSDRDVSARDGDGFLLFTLTAYSYRGEWVYSIDNARRCDHTRRLHRLIVRLLSTFVDYEIF